jgi:hypothetical protein
MLWTLFVILLIAWLVGLIGFHVVAWYIHILLVVALVVSHSAPQRTQIL